jgi:thiol-disulfide isomerase/thioredoxin
LDSGTPVSTADLVGEVPLVVSLWAVWCQPCKRELPELQELAQERTGQIDVVGVNIGDDADRVQMFLTELGVRFPMYRDVDGLLLSELDVPQVPATAVVLPSGEVAWLHLGEVTREQVESAVDAAVATAEAG